MLNTPPPNAEAARGTVPTRPIITLSVTPMSIWLTCPITIGIARSMVPRASLITACITEVLLPTGPGCPTLPEVDKRRALSLAVAATATFAALWAYVTQPRATPRHRPVVPIQDGQTIDFSGGRPVIKDSAADKASMDAALKQIDEATTSVTFPAEPAPTPAPKK
jgi:hypothetical protein